VKVLVTGGRGQLGRSVTRRGVASGHVVVAPDLDELDIRDEDAVARVIEAERPDVVINAAAYTAVDRAETERELAFAINRDGAGAVALACAAAGRRLLHVSTDYVFDGAGDRPYREDDPRAPLGAYGASKAAGEDLVHAAGGIVVRTSWLFAERGPGFVQTILRLARERPSLRVVVDQHGCPTWAEDLADGLLAMAAIPTLGPTYHYVGAGATTWHALATAIVEAARAASPRPLACTTVEAIPTSAYPTPAARPAYSVLDTSRLGALGVTPPSWTIGLGRVVAAEVASWEA
jgi:dTDP-4-dehydrorhamnose reductase